MSISFDHGTRFGNYPADEGDVAGVDALAIDLAHKRRSHGAFTTVKKPVSSGSVCG